MDKNPEGNTSQRDGIGNNPVLQINKNHGDQRRQKKTKVGQIQNRLLKMKPGLKGNKAGQQFHKKITERDFLMAMPTPATKKKITEQGNVVVPDNKVLAMRTMGTRFDDRLPVRKPVDNDIQKTADQKAEEEGKSQKHEGNLAKTSPEVEINLRLTDAYASNRL